MDPLNTALNANLNLVVVFSLLCLSIALLVLLGILLSLVPQINRTLYSYERLADTLSEVRILMSGFLKLQNIAQSSVSSVSDKVENVTDDLTRAADDAKKRSSVISAGILAGIREYLQDKEERTEG